jgi:hypothetical protein
MGGSMIEPSGLGETAMLSQPVYFLTADVVAFETSPSATAPR